MQVVVTTEARLQVDEAGQVWSDTGGRAYDFWARYLNVFDEVLVLARVQTALSRGAGRVEGAGVRVVRLPDYHTPMEYFARMPRVLSVMRYVAGLPAAYIARVPGAVGSLLISQIRRQGKPYGLEVVGDPYDAFSPGASLHLLRPAFRAWFTYRLRKECANACGIAYVTEAALQRRYPAKRGAFVRTYSSVQLGSDAYVMRPRLYHRSRPTRLVTAGSMEHLYKAQDVLIDAVKILTNDGVAVSLTLVGDGKFRSRLQARVTREGLDGVVRFTGRLPAGAAVRKVLDASGLFVLPSRQEGLPRAMLEAMARGLPCIGSTVGGIPELLPPEDLVPPSDAMALASKIREVITDADRLAKMSERNLAKAKLYEERNLRQRRNEFYSHIRECTLRYTRSRPGREALREGV